MISENKNLTISINQTIRHALEKIDRSGLRSIIVVDKNSVMKGIITDGDIRRAILKNKKLNEKTQKIVNSNPTFIYEKDYDIKFIKNIFLKKKIDIIPVIDKKKKIVKIVKFNDLFFNKNPIKIKKNPVVLMAGGLGKRLAPFTNILPKALLPLNGKPIIEHIFQSFSSQKFENFYLCLKHQSEIIKAYLKKNNKLKINFVNEKKPLGTCGALRLIKNRISTDFFLTNCDVLFDINFEDILNFHKKNKNLITIVASEKEYKIQYGVCKISKNGSLSSLVEKPSFDYLINAGLYLINNKILNFIPKKRFDLPDLINIAKKKKKKVSVYFISDKSWIDVGQWDELDNSSEKLKNFNK